MSRPQRAIIIWGSVWLIVTAYVFIFGFSSFQQKMGAAQLRLQAAQGELFKLQAEEENMKLASRDLEELAKKPLSPDDFFKKDTTLVEQVMQLERLASQYDIKLQLGLSGTVKSGLAVPKFERIVKIPVTVVAVGSFPNVIRFLNGFEHMSYVAHAEAINITSASKDMVGMTMSAFFFIKK